jgi:hypothetical protein
MKRFKVKILRKKPPIIEGEMIVEKKDPERVIKYINKLFNGRFEVISIKEIKNV